MARRFLLPLLLLPAILFAAFPADAAQNCASEFAKLVPAKHALNELPPIPVLIKGTGLSEAEEQLIRANAKAVIDAHAFLKDPVRKAKGFLLATDNINYTHEFFSSSSGLRHWSEGYRHVGIHPKAIRTSEFMGKITDSGEPVVFLVPPNIEKYGITHNEMKWLLENPEKMKNVTFVFGAYDLIPKEALDQFGRTRNWSEIRQLLGD